jgi:hypothetical protein
MSSQAGLDMDIQLANELLAELNTIKEQAHQEQEKHKRIQQKIYQIIERNTRVCRLADGSDTFSAIAEAGLLNDITSRQRPVWLLPSQDYSFTNQFTTTHTGDSGSSGFAGWVNSDPKDGRMIVSATATAPFGNSKTTVSSVLAISDSFIGLIQSYSPKGTQVGNPTDDVIN